MNLILFFWKNRTISVFHKTISQLEIRFSIFFFFLLTLPLGIHLSSFADTHTEHQLETAFIYQFTNYIEWPTDPSIPAGSPFIISVLGSSPLTSELEQLARAKTTQSRKIEIHPAADISRLTKSHIVVITNSDENELKTLFNKLKGRNTLVISYADGFARKGAMINFFKEGGRLRFEINRSALERQNLQISSQLLKLAKVIDQEN